MQTLFRGRSAVVLLGIAFVVADQLVKLVALSALQAGGFRLGARPVSLALELSLNPGAFLSLGAAMPEWVKQMIFVLGVAGVVGWAGYWALRNWAVSTRQAMAVYAIALGGAGNLIDRVFRHGHVVDYMIINVGSLHTGVFNLADIAITAGALFLSLGILRTPRPGP